MTQAFAKATGASLENIEIAGRSRGWTVPEIRRAQRVHWDEVNRDFAKRIFVTVEHYIALEQEAIAIHRAQCHQSESRPSLTVASAPSVAVTVAEGKREVA